ncbi:hypothetical protein L249_2463 [Ophiocordyceps polyrhachis-furcata BCC 54312]|uniref:Uncharacterized protein n=1 Tax=Ophiocordyceps polyrhachis-furcata BCC 54312 TaxID=1330021 RepID=A0A367LS66_9HYPO|nr:hypothetical protein L249_2463 [Ophiocordyceps polyrhachis-furcata BCC 54312]
MLIQYNTHMVAWYRSNGMHSRTIHTANRLGQPQDMPAANPNKPPPVRDIVSEANARNSATHPVQANGFFNAAIGQGRDAFSPPPSLSPFLTKPNPHIKKAMAARGGERRGEIHPASHRVEKPAAAANTDTKRPPHSADKGGTYQCQSQAGNRASFDDTIRPIKSLLTLPPFMSKAPTASFPQHSAASWARAPWSTDRAWATFSPCVGFPPTEKGLVVSNLETPSQDRRYDRPARANAELALIPNRKIGPESPRADGGSPLLFAHTLIQQSRRSLYQSTDNVNTDTVDGPPVVPVVLVVTCDS